MIFERPQDKEKPPDCSDGFNWWEEVDSNHRSRRQQIYSLPPLATRESSHMKLSKFYWWAFRDLNPGPTGYEPVALTN